MTSPMSFVHTILACAAYYYFVKVLGPRFMKDRPAMELRRVLMAYNLFQIIFNGWMFYEMGMSGYFFGEYSLRCQAVNYSTTDEKALRALHATYWFFISKFIDFLDTVFFILRKKNNQITSLHVIHHGLMPFFIWMGTKYVSGGHGLFMAFVNCLVHVIMYFYYLVAAMGPRFERFIWWKKYLTTIQMVQFVTVSIHSFQLFFKNDCGFPIVFSYLIGGAEVSCLFLFIHFYRTTYNKNQKMKRDAAAAAKDSTSNGHYAAKSLAKDSFNNNNIYNQNNNFDKNK